METSDASKPTARKPPPTPTVGPPDHDRTAERDENLDHTLEDSFPASDPPSSIPDPATGPTPGARERKPGGPDDEP